MERRSQKERERHDLYSHLLLYSHHDTVVNEITCTQYAIMSVNNLMEAKYGFTLPLEDKVGEVLVESPSISTYNAHRQILDKVEQARRYSPRAHWSFARKFQHAQGVKQ